MSDVLIIISIIAAVIAGFVSLTQNNLFNLAGTQWMLIAIVLGIYAMYSKMKSGSDVSQQ